MEKVTGIGGFFFRAQDTKALAAWYRDTLGVNLVPEGPDDAPWMQEAGPTVFAPFSADTDYFGRDDQAFMLNFRVNDLDAMLAHIRSRWNVDGTKLLLTGMSDGGTFCYVSGLLEGSPFTHLAPVSAAFHPLLAEAASPERLAGLALQGLCEYP